MRKFFLISNFRRVLNILCFLMGSSSASELYTPTFRNTLFHLRRHFLPPAYEDGTDSVFRNVILYNSDAGELPKRKHNMYLIILSL